MVCCVIFRLGCRLGIGQRLSTVVLSPRTVSAKCCCWLVWQSRRQQSFPEKFRLLKIEIRSISVFLH